MGMKIFVSKMARFLLFSLGFVVLLSPLLRFSVRTCFSAVWFVLPDSITTLVCGDSHLQHAVNPDLFPGSINVSVSAETYLFTYYKIKRFRAENPQLKNIVLGFSYHNFSDKWDDFMFYSKYAHPMFSRYMPILDQSAKDYLWQYDPVYFYQRLVYDVGFPSAHTMSLLYNKWQGKLSTKQIGFYGGALHEPDTLKSVCKVDTFVRLNFYERGRVRALATETPKWLDSISAYCAHEKLKLYLVITPLSDWYLQRVPPKFAAATFHYIENITNPEVNVLNFSGLNQNRNIFWDGDHLNGAGANWFTPILKKAIFENEKTGAKPRF